jgi:hypothetical protein
METTYNWVQDPICAYAAMESNGVPQDVYGSGAASGSNHMLFQDRTSLADTGRAHVWNSGSTLRTVDFPVTEPGPSLVRMKLASSVLSALDGRNDPSTEVTQSGAGVTANSNSLILFSRDMSTSSDLADGPYYGGLFVEADVDASTEEQIFRHLAVKSGARP